MVPSDDTRRSDQPTGTEASYDHAAMQDVIAEFSKLDQAERRADMERLVETRKQRPLTPAEIEERDRLLGVPSSLPAGSVSVKAGGGTIKVVNNVGTPEQTTEIHGFTATPTHRSKMLALRNFLLGRWSKKPAPVRTRIRVSCAPRAGRSRSRRSPCRSPGKPRRSADEPDPPVTAAIRRLVLEAEYASALDACDFDSVVDLSIPLSVEWFIASLEEQAIRRCPRCGGELLRSKYMAIPACPDCLARLDREIPS